MASESWDSLRVDSISQEGGLESVSRLVPCDVDKFSDVFIYLWQQTISTDASFQVKCGDDWIDFTTHKLILSMWSPVFADMLRNQNTEEPIRIVDVTPIVFEALLKYMYGSLQIDKIKDISFVLKLYKASLAYDIEALKEDCRDVFAHAQPDRNNVFQLLDAAKLLNSTTLELCCQKVLQSQTAEVLAAQELCNVTKDMLMIILNLPRVSFSSEYELVIWVFAWAKNEALKRAHEKSFRAILDEVLPYLNLTKLTAEEFGRIFKSQTEGRHVDDHLMTVSDGFAIFMNIANPGSYPLPPWCSNTPRERRYRNQK